MQFSYIGSYRGPEKKLVKAEGIHYEAVFTGKLRRYFDLRNFTDLIKLPLGFFQAWVKLGRLKPDVVFSKGGFVAVPVVIAAWLRRIPVLIHESDAIPGLTTKISARFAWEIFTAYENAKHELGHFAKKTEVLGNPIRDSIFKGSKTAAKKLTKFSGKRPVLLVMGGSTGAKQINDLIAHNLDELTKTYDIIHLTGEGKGRKKKSKHYFAMPYANKEIPDLYALSDLALSRAGANSLAEFEALQLPTLLYPLGMHSSRGDQLANAQEKSMHFKFFKIIDEDKNLIPQLKKLPKRKPLKKNQMKAEATDLIAERIITYL